MMFDIVGMNRSTDRFEHAYSSDSSEPVDYWELSEEEKEEADELNLDEDNYRIFRKYRDGDLYAEWEE